MTGQNESKLSLSNSIWIPLVSGPMPSALYLIYLQTQMILPAWASSYSSNTPFHLPSLTSNPWSIISSMSSFGPKRASFNRYSKQASLYFQKSELLTKFTIFMLISQQNTSLEESPASIWKVSILIASLVLTSPFLMEIIILSFRIPSLNLSPNPFSLAISSFNSRYATLAALSCRRVELMMESRTFSSLIKNEEYKLEAVILYRTDRACLTVFSILFGPMLFRQCWKNPIVQYEFSTRTQTSHSQYG